MQALINNDSLLQVTRGRCYVFFAFDIGLGLDLEKCDEVIKAAKERTRFRRNRRAPVYFDYDPPPLRITQQGYEIRQGSFTANSAVDLTLFDFGAVSVCYTLEFSGPFTDLIVLSEELYDNKLLLEDAHERVEQLQKEILPAIKRPVQSNLVEDYTVYQIDSFNQQINLKTFWETHAASIAQVLRSESQPLSEGEVSDALSCRISYGQNDELAIDWNAALVVGSEIEDLRAVLEFGNVDLLEMRYLDEQLDDALERAYSALTSGKSMRADMKRIAQLQVDGAMLFEAVDNALKLTGDQYLARVYSLVSKRFHLAEWDASILRKLETLNSIYNKISDRADQMRSEFLEWVIIILILFEIVLPVLQGH
jgi:hypothetical protein